jgi:hypothetical protein
MRTIECVDDSDHLTCRGKDLASYHMSRQGYTFRSHVTRRPQSSTANSFVTQVLLKFLQSAHHSIMSSLQTKGHLMWNIRWHWSSWPQIFKSFIFSKGRKSVLKKNPWCLELFAVAIATRATGLSLSYEVIILFRVQVAMLLMIAKAQREVNDCGGLRSRSIGLTTTSGSELVWRTRPGTRDRSISSKNIWSKNILAKNILFNIITNSWTKTF